MNYPNSTRTKAKRLTLIISLAVVMGAVLLIDRFKSAGTIDASSNSLVPDSATATDAPSGAASSDSSATSDATSSTSSSYKDGTYSATSEYDVPRSYESIKVTLTVKDGKVVSSSVANSEGDPKSARFQEEFTARYKSYVIGRDLSSLDLSYVAGASDTTDGFNAAVAKIKSQAKA